MCSAALAPMTSAFLFSVRTPLMAPTAPGLTRTGAKDKRTGDSLWLCGDIIALFLCARSLHSVHLIHLPCSAPCAAALGVLPGVALGVTAGVALGVEPA